jgi:hypothetical protein
VNANTTPDGIRNRRVVPAPRQTQLGNHIRRCHSESGMTSAT